MADENKSSIPHQYDINAKWDACLDLTVRRFVYSSLGGAFGGLLLFSEFPFLCLAALKIPFHSWLLSAPPFHFLILFNKKKKRWNLPLSESIKLPVWFSWPPLKRIRLDYSFAFSFCLGIQLFWKKKKRVMFLSKVTVSHEHTITSLLHTLRLTELVFNILKSLLIF